MHDEKPSAPKPSTTWEKRVSELWEHAARQEPHTLLNTMRALVAERDPQDPEALYELASVYDYLGHEDEAIPYYRAALHAGLAGNRKPQAIIQLASSLRNTGAVLEAIEVLQAQPAHSVTGSAASAFLALALHDAGRDTEALQVALLALAPTLPLYSRVIEEHATQLGQE